MSKRKAKSLSPSYSTVDSKTSSEEVSLDYPANEDSEFRLTEDEREVQSADSDRDSEGSEGSFAEDGVSAIWLAQSIT